MLLLSSFNFLGCYGKVAGAIRYRVEGGGPLGFLLMGGGVIEKYRSFKT